MYLDYFSLKRHPFRITPDPSLFFPGGADGRGVILNALVYGITSGEGILKVIGEVGSGKTMLCRMLEEELPDTIEIVYIANPNLTAREILYAIAIELKLDVSAATERLKVLHLIQNYLLEKHAGGGSVVVFIEEAQSMPVETLEEIRLLSNLETHQYKLMQIVLFGQPELDKTLSQKNIRQLRERITHSFNLEPLSAEATSEYLRYRLGVAGCPKPQLFTPRAEKLIAKASSGLTRRINILADKALLAAYADSPSRQIAQEGNGSLVLPRHVKAAIRDSDFSSRMTSPWLLGGLAMATLAVIALLVVRTLQPAPAAITNPPVAGDAVVVETDQTTVADIPQASTAPEQPLILQEVVQESIQEEVEVEVEGEEQLAGQDVISSNPAEGDNGLEAATRIYDDAEISLSEQGSQPVNEGGRVLQGDTQSLIPEQALAVAVEAVTEESIEVSVEDTAEETTELMPEEPDEGADDTDTGIAGSMLFDNDESPQAEAGEGPSQDTETETNLPALTQTNEEQDVSLPDAPVTVLPSGLTELRMNPTADWLRSLGRQTGYTIQLFSVPSTSPEGLEEYLQFLQLASLLDETYICFMPVSSQNSGRWQVMHKVFGGVTPARNFINNLPSYIQQYGPYVRNLNGIQCSYPVQTGN